MKYIYFNEFLKLVFVFFNIETYMTSRILTHHKTNINITKIVYEKKKVVKNGVVIFFNHTYIFIHITY